MPVTTRGMRITDETMEQLQRLVRVSGKAQYYLLARAVERTYQETLKHPEYGPALRALEEVDRIAAKPETPPRKGRGAVVRLNEDEARALRRRAYEETGDPGQAPQLAREAIREKLLEKPEGD
jgi:predicted DNA-binding protein